MIVKKAQLSNLLPFSEFFVVISLLAVFMAVSFVGAFRIQLNLDSGCDEIMFIDPAINLYLGKGFNSSVWFAQTQDEFWAGYPPLYTFLLYLCLKTFGFSIGIPRILNIVLAAITTMLLWHGTIRLRLINTAQARILLVTLIIGIIGHGFNYRSGRPDILMALLAATAFWGCSIHSVSTRCFFIAVISALFPWVGLASVAYSVMFGSIVTLFLRRKIAKEMLSVVLGLIIGAILLYCFYKNLGVWDSFLRSTLKNPSLTYKTGSIVSDLLQSSGLKSRGSIMLTLISISIFIWKLVTKNNRFYSLSVFGLVSIICIPLAMCYLAAYPIYYTWMASIPLAICICADLSRLPDPRSNILPCNILILSISPYHILLFFIPIIFYLSFKLIRLFNLNLKQQLGNFMIVVSLFLWLNSPPARIVELATNWNQLDYAPVQEFVRRNIQPSDWVMTDFLPYYAVKQEAEVTMDMFYLRVMTNDEKERTSALIVQDNRVSEIIAVLGGTWYQTGDKLLIEAKQFYKEDKVEFNIYRRAGSTSQSLKNEKGAKIN